MARKEKLQKTNALRELERAGIAFEAVEYEHEGGTPASGYGLHIAELLGEDPDAAFKTLVTVTPSGGHVVCCIPVASELDLKKAAAAAGEKTLSMLPMKDLEAVTGYVRGGCSPVGMKKRYRTVFDATARQFDTMLVSAGRIGWQIEAKPDDLAKVSGAIFADILMERPEG